MCPRGIFSAVGHSGCHATVVIDHHPPDFPHTVRPLVYGGLSGPLRIYTPVPLVFGTVRPSTTLLAARLVVRILSDDRIPVSVVRANRFPGRFCRLRTAQQQVCMCVYGNEYSVRSDTSSMFTTDRKSARAPTHVTPQACQSREYAFFFVCTSVCVIFLCHTATRHKRA